MSSFTFESALEPIWDRSAKRPFQESWFLKLQDIPQGRTLWIRFTLLVSENGFRKMGEVRCAMFEKNSSGEIGKIILKESVPLDSWSYGADNHTLKLGECTLSPAGTQGLVRGNGKSLQWDFRFQSAGTDNPCHYGPVGMGVLRQSTIAVHENFVATGTCQIDDQLISWNQARGLQGHVSGGKNDHSWIWGHCASFVDSSGKPADFLFDGISTRSKIADLIPGPRITYLTFRYQGVDYRFNSLWDSVWVRSKESLTGWSFVASRGEISFHGFLSAGLKNFAGMIFEDTDGSMLYSSTADLSDMRVLVYRQGKLEDTLIAKGTAAYEVVSRDQNPYVPMTV